LENFQPATEEYFVSREDIISHAEGKVYAEAIKSPLLERLFQVKTKTIRIGKLVNKIPVEAESLI
jgi:hypothetical protein